jgi:hypothetical protein
MPTQAYWNKRELSAPSLAKGVPDVKRQPGRDKELTVDAHRPEQSLLAAGFH